MTGPWIRLQAAMSHDPRIFRTGFWGTVAFPAILSMAKLQGWEQGIIEAGGLDGKLLAAHLNVHATNGIVPHEKIEEGLSQGLDALIAEGVLEWVDDEHLQIRNWSKYQKDTTAAERMRRYRASKKEGK